MSISNDQEKKKEIVRVVSSKGFFVDTRSRKPNRIYKESYGDIICKIAEMEKIQSQESEDGTELVDAFASVMGPEHPGRVRLLGRGVTKISLKEKTKNPTSSMDELLEQKMEEMEERVKQRMLEKFEEQKCAMQQQIAINFIARLEWLIPDLQLDSNLLAFCARLCTSGETKV
ncbi:hypothetical protein P3S68_014253 [Capsicum galapagoense]